MGTCNFIAVKGISVGMVAEGASAEDIEHEIQEMVEEGFDSPSKADAVERILLNESENISVVFAETRVFAEKLQKWISVVLPPVFEENDIEEVLEVVIEQGYYSGFQLYVTWDSESIREDLAQCGVDGIEEIIAQVGNIKRTVEFLLVDYAFENGLGITSGGYTGGVVYEGISDTWKSYYMTAYDTLIRNFREFMEN